ncbi:hypothetical protein O9992_27410 [Vibrio lentus]|nr:hypothetical protein [Vibrio lentus]
MECAISRPTSCMSMVGMKRRDRFLTRCSRQRDCLCRHGRRSEKQLSLMTREDIESMSITYSVEISTAPSAVTRFRCSLKGLETVKTLTRLTFTTYRQTCGALSLETMVKDVTLSPLC